VNKVVFILYSIFTTFVSLRPMNSVTLEPWDKVFHLILYSVFAVLGYRVSKEPKQFIYICIGIVIYSGLMEVAQSFMPGRVMSAYDLLANTIGVLLGAVIVKKMFSAKNI
jgi:VanZ family protein